MNPQHVHFIFLCRFHAFWLLPFLELIHMSSCILGSIFDFGICLLYLQVLQYLLDDVSDFLSTKFTASKEESDIIVKEGGCGHVLKAFIDFISERERENFRSRRHDNEESVTLTTIHQVFFSFD